MAEMEQLRENYPPFAFYSSMNSLGTHDTPRILTLLGAGSDCKDQSREWRAAFRLAPDRLRRAKELLRMAALLLFAFPGSPTVYYGDEAGMEGYGDPFCRRPFPWGREERELQNHYRRLGQLRRKCKALRMGDIRFHQAVNNQISFTRTFGEQTIRVYVNRGSDDWAIPVGRILLARNMLTVADDSLCLGHNGYCILVDE